MTSSQRNLHVLNNGDLLVKETFTILQLGTLKDDQEEYTNEGKSLLKIAYLFPTVRGHQFQLHSSRHEAYLALRAWGIETTMARALTNAPNVPEKAVVMNFTSVFHLPISWEAARMSSTPSQLYRTYFDILYTDKAARSRVMETFLKWAREIEKVVQVELEQTSTESQPTLFWAVWKTEDSDSSVTKILTGCAASCSCPRHSAISDEKYTLFNVEVVSENPASSPIASESRIQDNRLNSDCMGISADIYSQEVSTKHKKASFSSRLVGLIPKKPSKRL